MIEITIKCDECKAVKQEANHWWVVIQATGSLTIKPWSDSAAKGLGLLHICGRECLQRAVSKFTEDPSETTHPVLSGMGVDSSRRHTAKNNAEVENVGNAAGC